MYVCMYVFICLQVCVCDAVQFARQRVLPARLPAYLQQPSLSTQYIIDALLRIQMIRTAARRLNVFAGGIRGNEGNCGQSRLHQQVSTSTFYPKTSTLLTFRMQSACLQTAKRRGHFGTDGQQLLSTERNSTAQWSLYVPHSGQYMYRTVVTICTAQWSLYVPHSVHYMYRTVFTICTAQYSIYVPHSGQYMFRTVVTICTAQWSLYVPHSGHYTYRQFNIHNSTFCPHSVFMCFVWI